VIAAAILFARLGQGHLANFDDCYYAQKAKEMVQGGDWLTPHFAGIPRTDNPPLFLWLMASAFLVFGVHDWAAIFWSALSGALCVPLVYMLARRLRLDTFEAWSAAIVLLGTQYFIKYARHAMFDVFLTLLFLVGILSYARAAQGDRKSFLLLGLATGLGVLTKSVLGLFPLAVAAAHMLWTGRARLLRGGWFVAGVALAALVAVPWYAAQLRLHGGAFVEEHFRWLLYRRGLGIGAGERAWWSHLDYLRELALVYWPWLPLAAAGAVRSFRRAFDGDRPPKAEPTSPPPSGSAWTRRDTARLLITWFCVVVGVMSVAAEKKLWYIMTVFPCLALLAGIAAGAWIRGASRRWAVVKATFAILVAVAIAVHVFPIPLSKARRPDLHRVALAARDLAPPGRKVGNLDAPYWSTVNQFLFYSDHDLTEPLLDPVRVRALLRSGQFALLTPAGYARVAEGDSAAYRVLARSGGWLLVGGATPGK
jgi:4-amino-4-deoxy-L-arabinose transferase